MKDCKHERTNNGILKLYREYCQDCGKTLSICHYGGNLTIDISEIASRVIFDVTITGMRIFEIKLFIVINLLKLAAFISGYEINVVTDYEY